MRKSKLIGFLLVLLAVCCVCSSCSISNAVDGVITTVTTDGKGDPGTSGNSTGQKPGGTTVPGVTTPGQTDKAEPDPEDMPHDEKLLLGGVNISAYKIVYGCSQMDRTYNSLTGNTAWQDLMETEWGEMLHGENKRAEFDYESALRLQKLIKDHFGIELEVVRDIDAPNESRYEILVGETNRAATANMKANANLYATDAAEKALKIDQYVCSFDTYLVEYIPEVEEKPEETVTTETETGTGTETTTEGEGDVVPDDGILEDEVEPEIQYKEEYTTQYVICGGSYGATWHAIDAIEAYFNNPVVNVPEDDESAEIDLSNVPKEDTTTEPELDGEEPEEEPAVDLANAGRIYDAYDFKAVACIGDSITRGSQGFPDQNGYGDKTGFAQTIAGKATATYLEKFLSWPVTVQRELWKDYLVCNYGQGYSTLMDHQKENSTDPGGPYYYNDIQKFTNLLSESNREDFDFDMVLIMLGTNDANRAMNGDGKYGTDDWSPASKLEFITELENLLVKISKGSPNAKFVFMNAPHRCDGGVEKLDGDYVDIASEKGSNLQNKKKADAAMRELQKLAAQKMLEKGYDMYCYDMGRFTQENLVTEGHHCLTTEEAEDMTSQEIRAAELKAHEEYYNILTDTGKPDATHPNHNGYGKIAEAMVGLVQHLLSGAETPEYMIDLTATEE